MNHIKPMTLSTPARQFKRLRYPPFLSVYYEGRDMEIRLSSPDISTHGMFINTPVSVPEGAVLKVDFLLPCMGFMVTARCEVRYCLPGVGVGVEFIDIPSTAKCAIEREIAAYHDLPEER